MGREVGYNWQGSSYHREEKVRCGKKMCCVQAVEERSEKENRSRM